MNPLQNNAFIFSQVFVKFNLKVMKKKIVTELK